MGHVLRAKVVDLADIDLRNDAFLLSPRFPLEPDEKLLASIKEFGLLVPPILLARDARYHQIVTGWRRIAAFAKIFPAKPIPCLVGGQSMKDDDCLSLALEDILLQRSPTPIETALFFKKSGKCREPGHIIKSCAARLGLPRSTTIVDRYIGLLDLEEPLVLAVHEKLLDERIGFELRELTMRDRLGYFNVVEQLRLSVSNQKKLLSGIRELAARHNSTIMALLGVERISEILNHTSANVPQKTAKLMQWLDRQRFPRLQAAEDSFRRMIKDLRLAPNMKIDHAPSFERDTLTLSVNCADYNELTKVLAVLEKIPLALAKRS